MILTVFIVLCCLALFLILLGYNIDIKVLSIVGAVGLFYLALVMNSGAILYQTGENITYTYDVNNTYITQESSAYNYTSLNDTTSLLFAKYLALASGFAFILILISNKKRGVV